MNDDGPPSEVSPYFLPFTNALQASGHEIRVVIPDKPLSWIGKAHAFGKSLTASRVCPSLYTAGSGCSSRDQLECNEHSWYILDGSPASCTQIGLFHSDWASSDVDLVISGPNHGRNASTIYNLSSGTVGGALEGALCGKKSISLSFGSKDPQPLATIAAACRRAVVLIERLYQGWNPAVELYNVNIPMIESVSSCPAVFAVPSNSYWTKGSLFVEHEVECGADCYVSGINKGHKSKRCFKWSPEFSDIRRAVERSNKGDDLWASNNNYISYAPGQRIAALPSR